MQFLQDCENHAHEVQFLQKSENNAHKVLKSGTSCQNKHAFMSILHDSSRFHRSSELRKDQATMLLFRENFITVRKKVGMPFTSCKSQVSDPIIL